MTGEDKTEVGWEVLARQVVEQRLQIEDILNIVKGNEFDMPTQSRMFLTARLTSLHLSMERTCDMASRLISNTTISSHIPSTVNYAADVTAATIADNVIVKVEEIGEEDEGECDNSMAIDLKVDEQSDVKSERNGGGEFSDDGGDCRDDGDLAQANCDNDTGVVDKKEEVTTFCETCYCNGSVPANLSAHDRSVSGLTCSECSYLACDQLYLDLHIKDSHNLARLKYQDSRYSTNNTSDLKQNDSVDDGGKRYKCAECGHAVALKQSLQQHIDSKHRGLRHACSACDFTTPHASELSKHRRRAHPDVKFKSKRRRVTTTDASGVKQRAMAASDPLQPLQLPPKSAPDESDNDAGIVGRTTAGAEEDVRFYCDQCAYSSTAFTNLKLHMESHHGAAQFPCNQCEYVSCSKNFLRRHKSRVHAGLRYYCELCEYHTSCMSNLRRHKEAKHEGVKYTCEECNYSATLKQSLQRHISTKHKGIKFPCNRCSFAANHISDLNKHKKRMHKDSLEETAKLTENKCDQCHFTAQSYANLKKHKKIKHNFTDL